MSYANTTGGFGGDSKSQLRSRLFFTGEVNDNWHYVTMLENNQYFEGQNESGDSDTDFQRAFLKGNIGVVDISAGRQHADYGDSDIYSMRVDSVRASVPFGDAYLKAEYGKMANIGTYGWSGTLKKRLPKLSLTRLLKQNWAEPGVIGALLLSSLKIKISRSW